MPQLVTITGRNGVNTGRTVPLLRTEVHTFSLGEGATTDVECGVVDVDGIERLYRMADLAGQVA